MILEVKIDCGGLVSLGKIVIRAGKNSFLPATSQFKMTGYANVTAFLELIS